MKMLIKNSENNKKIDIYSPNNNLDLVESVELSMNKKQIEKLIEALNQIIKNNEPKKNILPNPKPLPTMWRTYTFKCRKRDE